MRAARFAGPAAAAVLSACTSTVGPAPEPVRGGPGLPAPSTPAPLPGRPVQQGLPLSALPGWAEDDHRAAFESFRATCGRLSVLAAACDSARRAAIRSPAEVRAWWEARFEAQPVEPAPGSPSLLTGYFAPEYQASDRPTPEFSAAVRARPADLVPGQPYRTRAEIEAEGGPALAWMRPEELFFLQIQGSGTLAFPDGRRIKAIYAADNGRPFLGVARVMRERGLLADDNTSGDAIRAWLAAHRGPEAQAVMNANTRYIFFALQPDDGRDPAGAAGVPLPPGRAVAVDPSQHEYGALLWLDARAPALAGAFPVYRRLVTALDTGSAIRGPVRADLYLGRGQAAGTEAGRIRHDLRMWRVVPKS